MRFTVQALKTGAEAAREFRRGYGSRWTDPYGNHCPGCAISGATNVDRNAVYRAMAELLWTSAGAPVEHFAPVQNDHGQLTRTDEPYGDTYSLPTTWFQYQLQEDPKMVAAMFDTIICCANPDLEDDVEILLEAASNPTPEASEVLQPV